MARKRYGEDDILRLIREVDVQCHSGMEVVSACRSAGVSDKTYDGWRRKYGGMNRAGLAEMKTLEKENQRLKKSVADLELDKLILKKIATILSRKPERIGSAQCHHSCPSKARRFRAAGVLRYRHCAFDHALSWRAP